MKHGNVSSGEAQQNTFSHMPGSSRSVTSARRCVPLVTRSVAMKITCAAVRLFVSLEICHYSKRGAVSSVYICIPPSRGAGRDEWEAEGRMLLYTGAQWESGICATGIHCRRTTFDV